MGTSWVTATIRIMPKMRRHGWWPQDVRVTEATVSGMEWTMRAVRMRAMHRSADPGHHSCP